MSITAGPLTRVHGFGSWPLFVIVLWSSQLLASWWISFFSCFLAQEVFLTYTQCTASISIAHPRSFAMGRLRSRLYKTDRARDFEHEQVRRSLQLGVLH